MQRILSNFITPPPQTNNNNANDMPWLFVNGARGLATFAGILSLLLGAIDVIFSVIDPECIVGGVILMAEGLSMVLIEAPCLCLFLDFAFIPSRFLENKSLWIKTTLYLCFAIFPLTFCKSSSLIISCVFIFLSCALYFSLALGRKASAEEMRAKVVSENPSSVLVNNEVLPATSNSNPIPFYKQTQINTPPNKNEPAIVY